MKIKIALFFPLIFTLASSYAQVLPLPAHPALVTDSAHLLTADEAAALETRLEALNDSTSNQIAIVTIPTLGNMALEDYANTLLRTWGIGTKKNNNGVLLLVAEQEHKIRIETGYGLEGAIPDVLAKSIIDHDLTPYFREDHYYAGFNQAITDLGSAAAGEYHIPAAQKDENNNNGGTPWPAIIFLSIIVIGGIWSTVRSLKNLKKGGLISRRGSSSVLPYLLGPMIYGSGGDGFGGGGFGGGSFGGGGFGGFGGGGGGGGGASGGW